MCDGRQRKNITVEPPRGAEPPSVLESKEAMPKAAADAALRKLTAELAAQEQDRQVADTQIAEQEAELRKVNAELDALRLDFARQAEYCDDGFHHSAEGAHPLDI